MKSQTWLVTGGAGFIGSCFVEQAVRNGNRVIVLDALTYAGHRENLEHIPGSGMTFVQGNIADSGLVSQLLRTHAVDSVINFAAESHVDRSIDGPATFIETNIVGTFHLLRACQDYWKALPSNNAFRFLHVSTDEVYGQLEIDDPEKFRESTPLAPNSPYSASKASGDLLVRSWFHTFGFPGITTRCSNNYGPRQFPEKLIPYMIQCALTDKPLPVYGDGLNVRDWIHVEDHCKGIELALTRGKAGEVYCFGGNSERNNLQVVDAICKQLDRESPRADGRSHASRVQKVQDRLGHDRRYAIDDSRAQSELSFERRYASFEKGLENTVRWYLENQSWCQRVLKKGKA